MLASSKRKHSSMIAAGRGPNRTNKHSPNANKKQHAKKNNTIFARKKINTDAKNTGRRRKAREQQT